MDQKNLKKNSMQAIFSEEYRAINEQTAT